MHFLDQNTPTNIGIALAMVVIAFACWRWLMHTLDNIDAIWRLDLHTYSDQPRRHQIDPTNLDQILALHGINQADRADIIKGTKL